MDDRSGFEDDRDGPALAELITRLGEQRQAFLALSTESIRRAWITTIETLLDRSDPIRQRLVAPLTRGCGLSAPGLDAALDIMLGGVIGPATDRLFASVSPDEIDDPRPDVVILAGNIPALAVQPLLAALVQRRPVVLKSPSNEPVFAPALVNALGEHLPDVTRMIAAVTWPGGDASVEQPLFAHARKVVAYGGGETIEALHRQLGDRLLALGPKMSIALVDATDPDVELSTVARRLARDIALFDQNGCLSVQAVCTQPSATRALATALGEALEELASTLLPGPIDPARASAIHQLRATTAMAARFVAPTRLEHGTVVVAPPLPEDGLQPSPGARTVRIHPIDQPDDLAAELRAWRGHLQGIAVAGHTWT
ncbi:MAG: acyl-CoA reductase, partial [Acidobacteriota bacterium]